MISATSVTYGKVSIDGQSNEGSNIGSEVILVGIRFSMAEVFGHIAVESTDDPQDVVQMLRRCVIDTG